MSILCAVYGYQDLDREKDFLRRFLHQGQTTRLSTVPEFYADDCLIAGILNRNDSSPVHRVLLEKEFFRPKTSPEMVIWGCGEILPSRTGINDLQQLGEQYLHEGPGAFADVNGQWVILIRDRSTRRLVIARDRIGVCKIYYRWIGPSLYVSNTLQFFRLLQCEVDRDAIADFLRHVYIPSPRSIYTDVHSIPPGTAATVDEDRFCESAYVVPNDRTIFSNHPGHAPHQQEWQPALDRLHRHMTRAVRRSLGGSRPAAILLSGGKDSSSLAFAASALPEGQIHAYHIGSNNAAVDESRSAELLARHLRMPYRRYCFDPADYFSSFHQIIATMDQPFGDPTYFPVFLMLQRIKGEVDTVLDGTGNDSYFGVPLTPTERKLYRFRTAAPSWLQALFRQLFKGLGKKRSGDLQAKCAGPVSNLFAGWYGWSYDEIKRLLEYERDEKAGRFYELFLELRDADPVVLKTAIVCGNWEPENVFRRSHAAASSHGMRMRFPFLDLDLMKQVVALPTEMKFQDSVNKVLLRRYMAKHLPEEIVHKPKGYFIFDTNSLLAYNDFQLIEETLSESELKSEGLFNPAAVTPVVSAYRKGNTAMAKKLYAIILLRSWLQTHR